MKNPPTLHSRLPSAPVGPSYSWSMRLSAAVVLPRHPEVSCSVWYASVVTQASGSWATGLSQVVSSAPSTRACGSHGSSSPSTMYLYGSSVRLPSKHSKRAMARVVVAVVVGVVTGVDDDDDVGVVAGVVVGVVVGVVMGVVVGVVVGVVMGVVVGVVVAEVVTVALSVVVTLDELVVVGVVVGVVVAVVVGVVPEDTNRAPQRRVVQDQIASTNQHPI